MEEEKKIEETKKINWLTPTIAVIILVGGIYFVKSNDKSQSIETTKPTSTATEIATDDASGIITVEGGMFYFEPNVIQAKKGQLVKITFTNKEGLHDFVLEKFNVKTKQIKAGESETIEFTPNEIGEFEFYCSVANHRQQGMVGKFIVEN
ncbi:MAG: hypothetical protein ACD_19C00426G0108 [uncultured bacterium]|nr:MAG: hypothetical protein ACD_19C00426G0108 [uncultured bacterium]